MHKKTFKEVSFSLWAFKYVYTIDQLLEDGCDERDIVKYLKPVRNDVGFIWRCSYSENLSRVRRPKIHQKKIRSLLICIYNIIVIFVHLFRPQLHNKDLYATRRFDLNRFGINKWHQIRVLNVKSDRTYPSWFDHLSKVDNTWKYRLEKQLRDRHFDISDKAQYFIASNLDDLFPKVFTKKSRNCIRFGTKLLLINFAGDIFKSNVFFQFLWMYFDGKIEGAQHGGGYGIIDAYLFNEEMECYDKFHMHNFTQKIITKRPKNRLELIGEPGIILLGSMTFKSMEGFRKIFTKINNQRITKSRIDVRNILKSSGYPIYIREHPKSPLKSFKNTEVTGEDIPKPLISARKNDLIILEAPGTTAELDCIAYGLNYIMVFKLENFPLTPEGKKHYKKLQRVGKLMSAVDLVVFLEEDSNA